MLGFNKYYYFSIVGWWITSFSYIMIGSRSRAFRILYPCNRLCHFSKKLNTDIKPKTIWARNHLPFSSRTRLSSSLAEFGPPPSPPTTPILDEKENAGGQQATSQFLEELNPSQLQAVVQPLNAIIRVISGPGSGKTRVLTSRMAYLLQHDPDPRKRILGVTFTRKAAGEMQERLEQLVPDLDMLSNRVTLGTFHSICAKLLRWNGDVLSTLPSVQRDMYGSSNSTILNGDFTIIDEAEQLRILNTCLEQEKISLQESPLKPRTILGRFSDYKEKRSEGGKGSPPSQDSRPISFTEQIVAKVYPLYRENLLSRNSLDFDDLIVLTRDLLLHHSDRRERFQQHWTHVLVDEFQDTSKAQVDLVKLWTSSSLLVVGDADQSIYSWRGAHVSSLADFADEFAQWGKVETVFLMENYRSTSNIIKAAQKVISYQPSGTDSSGADRLRQNMKPKRGAGPPPRVVRFENETAEGKAPVSWKARIHLIISFVHCLSRLLHWCLHSQIRHQNRQRCLGCGQLHRQSHGGIHLSHQRPISSVRGSLRPREFALCDFWIRHQLLQALGNQGLSLFLAVAAQRA